MARQSFYTLVRITCLEVRRSPYGPHAIRSDVTEYVLNPKETSMRDVLQVTYVLGDQQNTVLQYHSELDVQRLLDKGYFKELDEDAAD